MKTLSLLIVVLLAGCASFGTASAARIARDGAGNHVRLTDEPCTSTKGALATMPPEIRKQARAGSVYWQGKVYEACWLEHDKDHDWIVDEDGDDAMAPKSVFKRETEI